MNLRNLLRFSLDPLFQNIYFNYNVRYLWHMNDNWTQAQWAPTKIPTMGRVEPRFNRYELESG